MYNLPHIVGPIGPYEAWKFYAQIRWVTHTPWKLTETYSGYHITQPIQHITLCCQDHDPLKCPVPKQHHQDTQYKHIHTKSVYQIFDILYANIVKMIYDIQYLRSLMQNRPK